MDLQIQNPCVINVAGPTMIGKSYFVHQLLTHANVLFSKAPSKIYWFASYLPKPVNQLPNVQYIQGLPDNFDMLTPNCFVVIDDMMVEGRNSTAITKLCTRGVHHIPCTLFLITQNLFYKGSETKTINLNSTYLVLFNNPRDKSQIQYIARQMYPKNKDFLVRAFENATTNKPYTYLFIDLHPKTKDVLRVRANILPHEAPMVVYIPTQDAYKL